MVCSVKKCAPAVQCYATTEEIGDARAENLVIRRQLPCMNTAGDARHWPTALEHVLVASHAPFGVRKIDEVTATKPWRTPWINDVGPRQRQHLEIRVSTDLTRQGFTEDRIAGDHGLLVSREVAA